MADRRERAPTERQPAVANPAAADVVYFDHPLAYIYAGGMGSITLSTSRQLVDTAGQPCEDRIVTGCLVAPQHSLLHLRAVIDDIERRAHAKALALEHDVGYGALRLSTRRYSRHGSPNDRRAIARTGHPKDRKNRIMSATILAFPRSVPS